MEPAIALEPSRCQHGHTYQAVKASQSGIQ
jgi:hypothetical protein